MTRDIRRIAVFRALQLGDLLVAVPALRSLRAGFPEAEITLLGLPWAEEFARQFGHYVDRFVEFPGYPGILEAKADPERTARFLAEQRAYGYDLVIQMQGDGMVSNRLVADLGGWITAGYYLGDPPASLTVAAPYPDDRHEILRNLGLAQLLGCPDCGADLEFPLFLEDRRRAVELLGRLQRSAPVVGIHPGARAPSKRWPPEHFAALADELVRRYGASIVITGSASEKESAREVLRCMDAGALDLTGRTSLGALAAVVSCFDLFVSNDSGPAHVAYAVGTASITLFGPVDPRRWGPLQGKQHLVAQHAVPCSPCGCWECPIDHRCLRQLRSEQVLALAARLFGVAGRAGPQLSPRKVAASPGRRDRGRP
jgi:ADP-heptose:LPS heptosyltransferase